MYTDAQHKNPLCKVTPLGLIKQRKEYKYDKEKYRDMLLEATEIVLGYFGFNRTGSRRSPIGTFSTMFRVDEQKQQSKNIIDSYLSQLKKVIYALHIPSSVLYINLLRYAVEIPIVIEMQ